VWSDPLVRAARELTGGGTPDWGSLDLAVTSERERVVLENLRAIAGVGGDITRDDEDPTETIGVSTDGFAPEDRWGTLQIAGVIGRGTHGTVFRAWDTRLAREVALKVLRSTGGDAAAALQEARLLARLRHPGIVTVYGADRVDGTIGWWMQLVDGVTLEALLDAQGPCGAREAAAIGEEVASALAAVHAAGLLHGDVKLQNIMKERGGRIVLMDFSTGRPHEAAEAATELAGTPACMAPEVLNGSAPTAASDIYALGVAIYRLVTGRFPVEARTLAELRAAHAGGTRALLNRVRPDLPPAFCAAVERALAPDPSKRYAAAMEFAHALAAATPHGRRRRWWSVPALMVVAAAAGAAAVVLLSPDADAPGGRASSRPVLSPATARLWTGFEDLAREAAARRSFPEAVEAYRNAIQVLSTELPDDSAAIGALRARLGWMWHMAGRPADARMELLLALTELEASVGRDHPLCANALTALAAVYQIEKNPDEALRSLAEALAIRQRFLGLTSATSAFDGTGIMRSEWSRALNTSSVAADSDGDGLSDVVETALHLDPRSVSTRTGIRDGDGDHDGDGWPDIVEVALDWDPTAIVSHFGAVDPASEGFTQFGSLTVDSAVDSDAGAAWRMTSDRLGHYRYPLPIRIKRAAMSGFMLIVRSRLRHGGSYVGLDLIPAGPRFDTDLYFRAEGRLHVKQNTSIVPHEGPEHLVDTNTAPLVLLQFEPQQGGRLWIDGRLRASGYRGFSAYQEDEGLFFGTFNLRSAVPAGEADYRLVLLTVRPEGSGISSSR
jgi:serine/threonine-protein kinase